MTVNSQEFLAWLRTRRSHRGFDPRPVDPEALERTLLAAATAPSSSNLQPWRFAVVTSGSMRAAIVGAIERRVAAIKAVVARSHHAADFGGYGDFFYEPLVGAPVIIVPQHRTQTDLLSKLLASGGGDPRDFVTPASMQPELCSTSASVMALLLQAHAEGLGACWMAGPTVARADIEALLGVAPPWRMLGAIALGHPVAGAPPPAPSRKGIDKIVVRFDDPTPSGGDAPTDSLANFSAPDKDPP